MILVFAEFGEQRQNGGDSRLPAERLEPALLSLRRYVERVVLYTDANASLSGVEAIVVKPPFDQSHGRYGWRANDYYKVAGAVEQSRKHGCPVIATDADMLCVSDAVQSAAALADRFGFCVPVNGRWLVKTDAASTCDGGPVHDESAGYGLAYAGCPILYRDTHQSSRLAEAYLRQMETNPVRGPLALWRAAWETRIHPYVLPPQWCVTAGMETIHDPILAHVGHESVRRHFCER